MEILSLSADVVPNAQQPPQSDKHNMKSQGGLELVAMYLEIIIM